MLGKENNGTPEQKQLQNPGVSAALEWGCQKEPAPGRVEANSHLRGQQSCPNSLNANGAEGQGGKWKESS